MAKASSKREAILAAALELFAERGFHGTAVPAVAERAGVGAGTIYRYFQSKDVLVNELYREHKRALSAFVLGDFPVGQGARAQFRHFWGRMAEFSVTRPTAFAFLELHSHGDYLDAESQAVEDQLLNFAAEFVKTGQARQELKDVDPMLLISLVYGAIVGLVRVATQGHLELSQETIEAAERCCWEAVRA